MSTTLSFIILAEVLLTLFVAWGFMHEELFVKLEDKIIIAVIKAVKGKKYASEVARRERINEKVVYTPVRPVSKKVIENDSAA